MKKFTDMRLDKLSYQEYHEKYPHEKYTVGFAGRPGKLLPLNWYIEVGTYIIEGPKMGKEPSLPFCLSLS